MNQIKLGPLEVGKLQEEGFLLCPEFLSENEIHSLSLALVHNKKHGTKDLSLAPEFDRLILSESINTLVSQVLGDDYVFHHANGRTADGVIAGKDWHHDYDGQYTKASPAMLHLLFYPNGLREGGGALAVLPKSHETYVDRSFPGRHGTDSIQGERVITGEPGLLVMLNSAVWHCRRPGVTRIPRFDFNLSYCVGVASRPERDSYGERFARMTARTGYSPLLVHPRSG